jgi:hypothetical protein
MSESRGELVLLGDADLLRRAGPTADVLWADRVLAPQVALERGRQVTVPFGLAALPIGESELTCVVGLADGEAQRLSARVTKLPPRPNAVQVDRVSGGLLVQGLPFFPFGFYCYSPVQPTLAEEEVVRGFSVLSPYQRNDPKDLPARRSYMDRCAELGMRVHFQVLSLAAGRRNPSAGEREERERRLRAEVEAFRDHPALLAWYISDEPELNGIPPEDLARTYRMVKETDPYHPITIVLADPGKAKDYAAAMDVVMTDPYPIPQRPASTVHGAITGLVSEFGGEKPVWMVPQAFGGNEWWKREPTAREERVMTYLGLIGGATGVQYFIRHGLNGFPKSSSLWAECGRLALEAAELTPALLSHEEQPAVASSLPAVRVAAWRERGRVLVLAVNSENRPQTARFTLDGTRYSGQAEVLFEGRKVGVLKGEIEDMIDGFGSRAYEIPVAPVATDDLAIEPRNLVVDPSFEDTSGLGTPASCYAEVGAGRGATYFLDSRVARHGRHSIRLVMPNEAQPISLRPYAPSVAQGKTYRLSVWAKAAETQRPARRERARGFLGRVLGLRKRRPAEAGKPALRLSMPGVGGKTFALTKEWREYAVEGRLAEKMSRSWISIGLVSPGTAWVDLLQLMELSPPSPASGPG